MESVLRRDHDRSGQCCEADFERIVMISLAFLGETIDPSAQCYRVDSIIASEMYILSCSVRDEITDTAINCEGTEAFGDTKYVAGFVVGLSPFYPDPCKI
jgi:hypothetical protein